MRHPRRTSDVDAYVALLRGINVGGKNKLPMKDLVAMFENLKCTSVRHYIQSGNVVFAAPQKTANTLPASVANAIRKRYGYEVPVVVFSRDEVLSVARKNPFVAKGADPKALHVAFLATAPSRAELAGLDPNRSPGDEFVARDRHIYFHLRNGVGKTRFTNAYLDSRLRTTSTLRNWATVTTILDMLEE